MELNKAQKLVRLVEWMCSPGGIRADTVCERFELDARTLRRYLADLKDMGLPVIDDGRSDHRTLSMDPVWRRAGVQLTLAEVLSLHFGRTLFTFLQGTQFEQDLNGAIERLQPAISLNAKSVVASLDTRFLAVPEPSKRYSGAVSECIDTVVTALVYSNVLEATYKNASGVSKNYTLEPYTLATFRQGLYLFARDARANVVKTFAVERFTDVLRARTKRFELPLGWTPHAHIAHAFGIISGPPDAIILAFHERVTAYIRERVWHPTQTFGTLPDGRLELRMFVAHTVELRTWVMGFGADVEVMGPPELRSMIADQLTQAAARYQPG